MNEPTMPLVSIGMPCYNVSADVERAIRSIQDGLYSNWELVCVDDGSTDSTPEILNRIASCDARVKVYRQHNGGVSKARNSCIEHAHGKYLAWVDPDDTVEPEFLDRIISLMENEQADYCVMAYRQKNLAQNATQWQTVHLRDNYLFKYSIYYVRLLFLKSTQNNRRCEFLPHQYQSSEIHNRKNRPL